MIVVCGSDMELLEHSVCVWCTYVLFFGVLFVVFETLSVYCFVKEPHVTFGVRSGIQTHAYKSRQPNLWHNSAYWVICL